MTNGTLLERKTKQRALFQVSKYELRQLLSDSKGKPLSQMTFWRLCIRMSLAQRIGMTEDDFKNARVFYLEHYERLKVVIGFSDSDLLEL